jgi:hypothetical protein
MPVDPNDPVGSEMRKFKSGSLHSGSPSGPIVRNRRQAIAIGLSEQRALKQGPKRPKGRGNAKR